MKVLLIIQRFKPALGGAEWVFEQTAKSLLEAGDEVTVYTSDCLNVEGFWDKKEERLTVLSENLEGVQVHRFKTITLPKQLQICKSLQKIPSFAAKCLFEFPTPILLSFWWHTFFKRITRDFDLIHASALPFSSLIYPAWVLARRKKIPLIISPYVHVGEPSRIDMLEICTKQHQLRLLNLADAVTVRSWAEKDALVALGVVEEKLYQLPIGIRPETLPGGQAKRFREKYRLRHPIVFHIARSTFAKGSQHLVQASELLSKAGLKHHLVLAGPPMQDFEDYLNSLPPARKSTIIMLNRIEEQEKLDLLAAGDIFAMPSKVDTYGIVFLEAWFYGKPVIGAYAGGVPDLIQDGHDGYLVPFGDIYLLAEFIAKLLKEPQLAKALGEAGREKVMNSLTWEKCFEQEYKLYQNLVAKSADYTG